MLLLLKYGSLYMVVLAYTYFTVWWRAKAVGGSAYSKAVKIKPCIYGTRYSIIIEAATLP